MSKAFTFLPLGAIIQEFNVNGVNIVQGFKTAEQYKQYNGPYFGETIGRIANRVAKGKFELNGRTHQLPINNGPNSLHGGEKGWGKCEFEGPVNVERNGEDAVLFKYLSKDGEEGYPGTVQVSVWYVQKKEQVNGAQQEVLYIEYEAELVGDEVEETAINMTNHRYVLQKSWHFKPLLIYMKLLQPDREAVDCRYRRHTDYQQVPSRGRWWYSYRSH